MTDTRQKILDTAKKLFSEKGYNAVSISEIANELQISKGNLTYHFKKKEDILQAILNGMEPKEPEKIPASLKELHGYFLHLQNITEDNVFYFRIYTQAAELFSLQREKQKKALELHRGVMSKAFFALQKDGMIKIEPEPGYYDILADNIFLLAVAWKSVSEIDKKIFFLKQAWNMVIPVLTEQGYNEYRRI